jgi:hypothetical protein
MDELKIALVGCGPRGGPAPTHLLREHFAECVCDATGKFAVRATLRDGVNSLLIAEAALSTLATGEDDHRHVRQSRVEYGGESDRWPVALGAWAGELHGVGLPRSPTRRRVARHG